MKRLVQGPANPVWLVNGDGEVIDPSHPLSISLIDENGNIISVSNPLPIGDGWELVTARDTTNNNSHKALMVEAGYIWHVLSIRVFFTADANAGDRQIAVRLEDSAVITLDEVVAGMTQAATEAMYYEFGPSLADLDAFRDTDWLMTPIPPTWILEPLHRIVVLDRNAISVAGDDMHVFYRYARRAL